MILKLKKLEQIFTVIKITNYFENQNWSHAKEKTKSVQPKTLKKLNILKFN